MKFGSITPKRTKVFFFLNEQSLNVKKKKKLNLKLKKLRPEIYNRKHSELENTALTKPQLLLGPCKRVTVLFHPQKNL